MVHYVDICIVGAGISGISCVTQLLESPACNGLNIQIFDMNAGIGGRVDSKYLDAIESIELGAGRYSPQLHPNFQQAMQDYDQKNDIYPFTEVALKNSTQEKLRNTILSLVPMLKEHGNDSFLNFISSYLGEVEARKIIKSMGYDALFMPNISAEMAYDIIEKHPETQSFSKNKTNQWFYASGGFVQLMAQMKVQAQAKGVKFNFDHNLVSLQKKEDEYHLSFTNSANETLTYIARHVILAIPPSAMPKLGLNFPEDWSQYQYSSLPLFKGFLLYDAPWWQAQQLEDKVIITDNPLRKIYFKGSKYIFFYTDSENASYWHDSLRNGEEAYLKEVHFHLSEALDMADFSVPMPKEHHYKYWPHGVEFCVDTTIDHPFALLHKDNGVIACSDAYTSHCGWMEGGILSAKKSAGILIERLSK
ncbi:FAD-dependent oxidoreductase [Chitinimonas sp. BJB300]|uniref:FAD-dependent oxidoreductase n=1 Tax=Chitinimonas sp. BJB300 TaxID=1559339 RepID=UPI000C0ED6F8|nr:FAD-dependent oxidoreductase [Chitinimonas sp. BJB300]PHV13489.1 tryptophan oxidase [Chitinimonas sp. BJB300]TSJ89826.1 FAD-dependent oxidoreductase [Chitinimonas sp. BJB300]